MSALLTISALLLQLAAPSDVIAEKPPETSLEALRTSIQCQAAAANSLDDYQSGAKTIAIAVLDTCALQRRRYLNLSIIETKAYQIGPKLEAELDEKDLPFAIRIVLMERRKRKTKL